MDKIILAGDGWGAVSALQSIVNCFSEISVCSTDIDVLNIAEECNLVVRDELVINEDELCVCAGYKKIITPDVVKKNSILNIHYSLLPLYRGLHSTVWAVINGENKHGLTIHLMNENIDDGPIIYQYSFEDANHTSTEIIEICNLHIKNNLASVLNKYVKGELLPREQDINFATWVCKRSVEDCLINFDWDVDAMKRFFRALVRPYPLPMICIKGRHYEVLKAEFVTKNYQMTSGRVVNKFGDKVFIKINGGLLLVESLLDVEAKQSLAAGDVLRVGMRLC